MLTARSALALMILQSTAILIHADNETNIVRSNIDIHNDSFGQDGFDTINIGLIYEEDVDPITGPAVLRIAERKLRADGIIQSSVKFNIVESVGCEFESGLGPAFELYYNRGAHVLIGPACDDAMEANTIFAGYWNLPVVGYRSRSDALSDDNVAPTFARTSVTYKAIASAVVNLMLHFRWLNFAFLVNSDPVCNDFQESFDNVLSAAADSPNIDNMTLALTAKFNFSNLDVASTDIKLEYLRRRARIVVICPGANAQVARPLILKLIQYNLTGPDYQYIIPQLFRTSLTPQNAWESPGSTKDGKDGIVMEAYKRINVVDYRDVDRIPAADFAVDVKQTMIDAPFNHSVAFVNGSIAMQELHDAMLIYGIAVNKTLQAKGDITNGRQMQHFMTNITIKGATGNLKISSGGEVQRIFYAYYMDVQAGNYTPFVGIMQSNEADSFGWLGANISLIRTPLWHTPSGEPPDDAPNCGFYDELCQQAAPTAAIAGSVAGILVVLLLATTLISYRLKQISTDRLLYQMAWKVERHEIHKISRGREKEAGQSTSTASASGSVISGTSTGSNKSSEHSALVNAADDHGMLLCNRAPFVGVGDFRDMRVAVKIIRQYQSGVSLTKKDLLRLHLVKELRHENLCMFVGIVVNANPGLVLWAYCQRGSLDDILYNDHIELDLMFKSSMMRDLVKGLEFLHKSAIGSHGSLSTANCVIDGRWVLKLTDFGLVDVLQKLQQQSKSLNEVDDHVYSQNLLHLAPSILRQAFEKKTVVPTKEADIYSLAMVLFQILYREQPFTNMNITRAEIIRKIAYPGAHSVLRPTLPKRSAVNHGFTVLLNLSWDETPSARPNISSIKESVYALTKNYSTNIIDHVIKIMEQYTQNLEKVVEERTMELEAERSKADSLLREMLPRTVADDLKAGKSVLPESYEQATIYFSDVVQFASLCSTSTPLEIVNMLNALYSGFDNITKLYDVYKVETIGDAYMVASGLPIRNGSRHVLEIANMALHIRKFVATEFKIPHRPAEKIDVRIGIHTGPAAAGVIGLAMPRYCVFGDTVNTASRMESTSEGMKIQISGQTAKQLQQRREYLIESRGFIDVKGKGSVETFWLVDRIPVAEQIAAHGSAGQQRNTTSKD